MYWWSHQQRTLPTSRQVSFLNGVTPSLLDAPLCDQTHPADLFSVRAGRYLGNLGLLLRILSGLVLEFTLDEVLLRFEPIGIEPEYRWTVRMAKSDYQG